MYIDRIGITFFGRSERLACPVAAGCDVADYKY